MKSLSKQTQRLFKEAGRQGGLRRARGLDSARRRDIARQAAIARWKTPVPPAAATASLPSARLREPVWSDPVYLEEVLSFGTLADWRLLYHRLLDHPFGSEVQALEKVCQFSTLYGVTPLWGELLRSLQGYRR